jgi:outer membrane receptor protein involved in Fe transport
MACSVKRGRSCSSCETRDGVPHPALGVLDGLTSEYDGDNLDYRVAAQYSWTEQVMTYLQFSTGFKGGGVSPRPFSYQGDLYTNGNNLGQCLGSRKASGARPF